MERVISIEYRCANAPPWGTLRSISDSCEDTCIFILLFITTNCFFYTNTRKANFEQALLCHKLIIHSEKVQCLHSRPIVNQSFTESKLIFYRDLIVLLKVFKPIQKAVFENFWNCWSESYRRKVFHEVTSPFLHIGLTLFTFRISGKQSCSNWSLQPKN